MISLSGIWNAITAAKAAIFTGAVCIALCLPLGYCKGYSAAKSKATAELALANVAAQDKAISTADMAATERVFDAVSQAKQQTELTDAISDIPDTQPDAVRVVLGCQRLRAAGRAEADLPAACRHPGSDGSKAATH